MCVQTNPSHKAGHKQHAHNITQYKQAHNIKFNHKISVTKHAYLLLNNNSDLCIIKNSDLCVITTKSAFKKLLSSTFKSS